MAATMISAAPALTLVQQAETLKLDLTASLTEFFAQIPELTMIQAQSTALVEQAKTMKVTDNDTYTAARDQIQALNSVDESFAEIINPYTKKAFALHRTLTGIEKGYRAAGEAETARLKREMSIYAQEQERKRKEEEQRIAEDSRKREQERLLAEATTLEAEGKTEAAAEVFEEAVSAPAPAVVLPSSMPTLSGTSQRAVWTFDAESIDKTTLNPQFLIADVKAIGQIVRSMKGQAERLLGGKMVDGKFVPAVKVFETKTTIVR